MSLTCLARAHRVVRYEPSPRRWRRRASPYEVTPGAVDATLNHTAFPAIISGPVSFYLLAIWALPQPSHVRAILQSLETYADFLRCAPAVIIGDFNCFAHWQGKAPSKHHVELAQRLGDEFALVSAYHSAPEYNPSEAEAPTYFFRWKENRPFHVDIVSCEPMR